MENLIEHEGKKYRVVEDEDKFACDGCCFDSIGEGCLLVDLGAGEYFPNCVIDDCHFELVEETNQKE